MRASVVSAAIATFVGGAALLFLACEFPDPGVEDGNAAPDSAGVDGATTTSGAEGGSSGKPDTGPCDDASCDCDHDGFLKASCVAAGADSEEIDCDDTDPRVKPDAGLVGDRPEKPGGGDWNCNGKVEPEYSSSGINCGGSLAASSGCGSLQGFVESNVPCGESRQFKRCKAGPVNCADDLVEDRLQRCR